MTRRFQILLALLLSEVLRLHDAWVSVPTQGLSQRSSLRGACRRQANVGVEGVVTAAAEAVDAADAGTDLLAFLGGSLSWLYVFLIGAFTLVAGLGQIFQMDQQEDEIPGVRFGLGDRVAAEVLKRREELEEGVEIVADEGDDFRQVVEAESGGRSSRLPLPAWLAELETEGLEVDLTVYDSLIESAARSGDLELAECWFRQALKMQFQPKGSTYENLAIAAAKSGDMTAAMVWLERAQDAGQDLGKATFTAIIEAMAQKGDLSAAELWFRRAQQAGVEADAAILTALRQAAVNSSDASETRQDLPDDIDIIGTDAFVELGTMRKVDAGPEPKANIFLEKLKVTDLDLDERSGSQMLISTCRNGDVEAAEFWLNKCRKMHLQVSSEAYHAVIELAGRLSNLETCERLWGEAKRSAVKMNRSCYSALVIAASRDQNFTAARRYFDEALEPGAPGVTGLALQKVVTLALELGEEDVAAKCFAEATAKGTKAEAKTYRDFTLQAASQGDMEVAEGWMKKCRDSGLKPQPASFNAMVKGYLQSGDYLAAGRAFRQAEAEDCEPTANLLGSMLRNTAFKHFEFAQEMLDFGLNRGLVPEASSFTVMVKAALRHNDPQAAEDVLSSAVRFGVRPEAEAFDAMICHEDADLIHAEKWFARMGRFQVQPTQASFSGLVNAAARAADLPMAEYWYDEALKVGVQMEGPSYAKLVMAAEIQGDAAAAEKWFKMACQRQATIKASFVEQLLSILLDRGDLKGARSWLQRAREVGIEFEAESVENILKQLMRTQNFKAADQWFEYLQEVGISLSPGIFIEVINSLAIAEQWRDAERWYQRCQGPLNDPKLKFDRLIILAARGGDYAAAERWYERSRSAQHRPDAMAFVALVHAACEHGQGDQAERWFQEVIDSDLTPTVNLYTPLVRRFAQDGQMEKAEAWFQRILEAGLKPGIFPYTSLVSGFLRLKKLKEAEEWLRKSLEAGLKSDDVMYSALIDGYCKEGSEASLRRAMELVEVMLRGGAKPKQRLMIKLLRCHAERGNIEAASRCADLSESAGVKIQRPEYLQLLKACANSSVRNRTELAEQILRQMISDGLVPNAETLTLLQPLLGRRLEEICPKGHVKPPPAQQDRAKPPATSAKPAPAARGARSAAQHGAPLARLLHSARGSKKSGASRHGETLKLLQDLEEELGEVGEVRGNP